MNIEDFEARFKKHDPASSLDANLTPSQLAQQAMDREVGNVVPIATWSRKRKAISAVAAGLLFVGVSGPLMSGAMTAGGPERFVFGSSPVSAENSRLGSVDALANSDMKIGLPYLYSYYIFESDIALSNQSSSAMTYSVVARDDAEQVGRDLARSMGISKLTTSEYDENTLLFESENKYFAIYLTDSFTSVSYSDYTNDPWRDCYVEIENPDGSTTSSDSGSVEECQPKAENLPSQAEAKRLATQLFSSIGIDSSDFKFEIWTDQAFVSVTATEYLNGHMTPVSWNVTYTSNSEISWLYASLTELQELDEYGVISEAAALKRINELNSSRIDDFDMPVDVQPETKGSTDTSGSSTSGDSGSTSSEPNPGVTDTPVETSEPIVDPTYTFEPQIVHVTRVEMTYETFWLADGSVVWLPTYQFFGYIDGTDVDETYPLGTIVALVDDAIDLESLYGASLSARMID